LVILLMPNRDFRLLFVAAVLVMTATNATLAQAPSVATGPMAPAVLGTRAVIGKSNNLEIEVTVQGPAAEVTPLQVACVFEYVEGDIFAPPALPAAANGMVHLDSALHGLVTDLRASGRFAGHALETILITPPKGTVPATRLLLVGLGDRREFAPGLMSRVGTVATREAMRLNVASFSFASDLKDAGIDSPTGEVVEAVLSGALEAIRTHSYLAKKGAGAKPSVRRLTLLAGPAFFHVASAAAREFLTREAAAQPSR
jgi:hypothetical protein